MLWAAVCAMLVAAPVERVLAGGAQRIVVMGLAASPPWILRVFAGLIVWPLTYTLAFEAARDADALTGFVFGSLHAAVAEAAILITGFREREAAVVWSSPRSVMARVIPRILYGTILGYIYVVPVARAG
jgi:hypothetical protein